MAGPLSRYRIYGGPVNYANSLLEIASGQWTKGDDVQRLERKMEALTNSPHAIAAPLARVGIYLAIKHLIKPGAQVLMSPYTISDVVNMVIAAGGVPRFVDVDPATGNMDPEQLKLRISTECQAILVTHLHGIPARMEEIMKIARQQGLPVIEDNAQAFGSRVTVSDTQLENASHVLGTVGDVGILSFGSYKNINAWFGGMILTKHRDLAEKIRAEISEWPLFSTWTILRKIRQSAVVDIFGWEPFFSKAMFPIFRHGFINDIPAINRIVAIELDTARRDLLIPWFKSQMAPGQARRVLEQLETFVKLGDIRIEKAKIYDQEIPSKQGLIKPPSPNGRENVYTYYALQADRRQDLLKWLMFFDRDIAPQHLKNCAHLESFKEFYHPCPQADLVARRFLLLPTYPSYRIEEVKANIDVIQWFIDQDQPEFKPNKRRALESKKSRLAIET